MPKWTLKFCSFLGAAMLALTLTGCGDDRDSTVRAFFSLLGFGNYASIVIVTDLKAADGTLDGAAEDACEVRADIAASCRVEFLEAGDDLIVRIFGCTIDDLINLYSCVFLDGAVFDLEAATSALGTCDARSSTCKQDPEACVADNETDCLGVTTTEFVTTSTTLEPPTTTTSTTTTSTTSTTTTSTTTTTSAPTTSLGPISTMTMTTTTTTTSTTLPDQVFECDITFNMDDDVTAGALQFDVDYSAAPGSFPDEGSKPDCTTLVAALAANNDNNGTETLAIGLIALGGFSGPTDVVSCRFLASTPPVAGDFAIDVVDASDPSLSALDPFPPVIVSSIVCDVPSTTTTTTTMTPTTITMKPPTTTLGGEEALFDITFRLDDAVLLGALQFSVDYSGAPGAFVEPNDCAALVAALGAFNDDAASSTLGIGLIALGGFTGPVDVASCTFAATSVPVPGDFALTVIDASDPSLSRVDPFPDVSTLVAPAVR